MWVRRILWVGWLCGALALQPAPLARAAFPPDPTPAERCLEALAGRAGANVRLATQANVPDIVRFILEQRRLAGIPDEIGGRRYDTSDLDDVATAYGPGRGQLVVIEMDGRIVGCGGITSSGGKGYLKRMYLDGSLRGLGLGQALMDRLLAKARELNLSEIELDTRPSMTAAIRLYERNGFQRVSEEPGPHGRITYRLTLAARP